MNKSFSSSSIVYERITQDDELYALLRCPTKPDRLNQTIEASWAEAVRRKYIRKGDTRRDQLQQNSGRYKFQDSQSFRKFSKCHNTKWFRKGVKAQFARALNMVVGLVRDRIQKKKDLFIQEAIIR